MGAVPLLPEVLGRPTERLAGRGRVALELPCPDFFVPIHIARKRKIPNIARSVRGDLHFYKNPATVFLVGRDALGEMR